MNRLLKRYHVKTFCMALLVAGALCLQACNSSGGGGGSATSTQPTTTPTTQAGGSVLKVTSTPENKAYLDQPYSYTLQVSDPAATVSAVSVPPWLHLDPKTKKLSGTPREADIPSPSNSILVAVDIRNQTGVIQHAWSLYYLQSQIEARTYAEPVPDYTPAHIQEVEKTDFHQARNLAALYIHGHDAAKTQGLEGHGVHVAIIDSGIDKSSVYDNAVVYRCLPNPPSMADSHGTRMAGYLLRFAPRTSLFDLSLNYPYPLLFGEAEVRNARVVNLSASAQNTMGFVKEDADSMAGAIKKGAIISHSIGNLANLAHDRSDQKIWYTDRKTGNIAWSDDTLKSYKFGNPFNFLPLIEGYTDLYAEDGALVQVQGVTLDSSVSDLGTVSTDKLAYDCIRSRLGLAMHDGISVIENGNGATSQAAASFSGMMALLVEYNETLKTGLTGRQIVDIVFHTATDIGAPGVDSIYGHGLVNMTKAMELMDKIARKEASVPKVIRSTERVAPGDFNELTAMRKILEEA